MINSFKILSWLSLTPESSLSTTGIAVCNKIFFGIGVVETLFNKSD